VVSVARRSVVEFRLEKFWVTAMLAWMEVHRSSRLAERLGLEVHVVVSTADRDSHCFYLFAD
jgi:hypothetical protein